VYLIDAPDRRLLSVTFLALVYVPHRAERRRRRRRGEVQGFLDQHECRGIVTELPRR